MLEVSFADNLFCQKIIVCQSLPNPSFIIHVILFRLSFSDLLRLSQTIPYSKSVKYDYFSKPIMSYRYVQGVLCKVQGVGTDI